MSKHLSLSDVSGFTLIELVVSLSILTLLLSLTLVGVQSAREAARRMSCHNNVRQLGLAVVNLEAAHGHFPTNGWGYRWIGEPELGVGKEQPGGWAYCVLPFLEQEAVHSRMVGLDGSSRLIASARMIETPVPVFVCASWPTSTFVDQPVGILRNGILPRRAFNMSYAGCSGTHAVATQQGPINYRDSENYRWTQATEFNGVLFCRSKVPYADILDGASNTILLGEKHRSSVSRQVLPFGSGGFNQSMYLGDSFDTKRFASVAPILNGRGGEELGFGSFHPAGVTLGFCDGRTETIAFGIDMSVYQRLADRNDRR